MNQRNKQVFLFAIFLSFSLLNVGAFAAESIHGPLGTALDLYFQRAASFGFSGAVLVSQNQNVILNKGYGWSDRKREIAITPQTVFSVASITKHFTAAAIMKLEEQGKIKTSDLLTKHFTGVPEDKKTITVHQLLSHTSGLGNPYAATGIQEREKAVAEILKSKLLFVPGERYNYSNDGYSLLAALIEVVSGETYADFLRRHLFKPAGMNQTGLWDEKNIWNADTVAHSYNMDTDYGSRLNTTTGWGDRGSGDLMTSAEDLQRWDRHLTSGNILSSRIINKMSTPHAKMPNGWHYGYGWMRLTTPRGTTELYHGGGDVPQGFTAAYQRYIDENITMIVLVNAMYDEIGLRNAVRDQLQAIVFGGNCSLPPQGSSLKFNPASYQGVYELSAGQRISILFERGQLFAHGEGQNAIGMLLGYSPELDAQLQKLTERVSVALKSAQNNSFSEEVTAEQWAQFIRDSGSFVKFEILGTAPVNEEISTTYARLHFETGSEVYRWVWRNKTAVVTILSGTDSPAIAPLVPLVPEKFLTHHLLLKTTAQLGFSSDYSTLSLTSPYGKATARRVKAFR